MTYSHHLGVNNSRSIRPLIDRYRELRDELTQESIDIWNWTIKNNE